MVETLKGLDYAKAQVKEFHEAFGHPVSEKPTPIPEDVAVARANWTVEELVEFLYATANNDKEKFTSMTAKLIAAIENAYVKILNQKRKVEDVLVDQMDALTDINYFTQGSFVVAGVDPQPLFDIVQEANMAKLWPDGKPRYDENNGGKIKKPEGWEPPEPKLKKEIERQSKLKGGC
jgi:predicted HAD superfamily Cof-like phosphohydrolase